MKIGYTLWPWMLTIDESTGTLSTNPNVIRPAYETGLKEVSFLGYQTAETFTPIIDAYENDSKAFLELHEKYGMSFVCLYAHLSHNFDTDLRDLERNIRFMKENKIPLYNLQMPMRDKGYEITHQDLVELAKKCETVAKTLGEAGVTLCIHQHLNSYVETKSQFEDFAALTDSNSVKFCFDTAHLYLGGMDCVSTFEKYADRIAYVHLKDVSFVESDDPFSRFRPLGHGLIDFPNVVAVLKKHNYDGILCVEYDRPLKGNFEGALFSRNYFRSVLDM